MEKFLIRISAMNGNFGIKELSLLLVNFNILVNDFPILIVESNKEDIDFYVSRSIFCKSVSYFIKYEKLSIIKLRINKGMSINSNYRKRYSGNYIDISGFGCKTSEIRDELIKYTFPLNGNPSYSITNDLGKGDLTSNDLTTDDLDIGDLTTDHLNTSNDLTTENLTTDNLTTDHLNTSNDLTTDNLTTDHLNTSNDLTTDNLTTDHLNTSNDLTTDNLTTDHLNTSNDLTTDNLTTGNLVIENSTNDITKDTTNDTTKENLTKGTNNDITKDTTNDTTKENLTKGTTNENLIDKNLKSKIKVIIKEEIVYFGEEYVETNRKKFLKWGIKNRKFIGHTSLDLELSIFMINACRLDSSSILYDPCCGSCSILHAAAIFGIHSIGTEIERKELIGRNIPIGKSRTLEKGFNVFSNFNQYKVENNLIAVTVGDLFNSPIHNYDVILTDPPYGIRASVHGNGMLRYYKRLLELGINCRFVGFWALSEYQEAIQQLFIDHKLICSLDQQLSNYTRTLFIYEMRKVKN